MSLAFRTATRDDLGELDRVIASAFQHRGPERRETIARQLRSPRRFARRTYRLGLDRGQAVSALEIAPMRVAIGRATVLACSIGDVAVHPDAQGRGAGTRMMQDTVRFLTAEGYDLARLGGYNPFYRRFGFVPYFRRPIRILRDARRKGNEPEPGAGQCPGVTIRPMRAEDVPACRGLHDAFWQGRTGYVLPGDELWELDEERREGEYRTVAAEGGRPVGFLMGRVHRDEASRLIGLGVSPDRPALLGLLLHHLWQATEADGGDEIDATGMPTDDEIIDALRCWTLDIEITDRHNARNGTMIQILNLRQVVAKLVPEFEARLAGTRCGGWEGILRLAFSEQSTLLRVEAGEVTVVDDGQPDIDAELPQGKLLRMLLGSDSLRRMGLDRRLDVGPMDAEMLDALFPAGNPAVGFQ